MVISITDTNHLRVIGSIGQREKGAIRMALGQWPHGTKESAFRDKDVKSIDPSSKCYFVVFNGSPWGAYDKNQRLHARVMIQTLINELKPLGWRLMISADVSAKVADGKHGTSISARLLGVPFVGDPDKNLTKNLSRKGKSTIENVRFRKLQ